MGVERLDPLIHPPARLQLMALLADVSEMEFGTARNVLGVSDSVLSKHLAQLSDGGYIELRKATVNTRQRTWIAATGAGRKAFKNHVAALQTLASGRALSQR
ncbi:MULTISPECIES: transcriptional regulator [unclassified Sphingomonas]|jgi:DNA-binding MarR family transcriptional regulator|uniref:transcriptional regulator n=1 Tax=unclassified Sphingomonas TaxID=196159 RepID=UPI0006F46678|nr:MULTISPECIES: transcriptional regulator [unclassified Sphingomonas]KQN30787.1 MarR family transcriptional regulator [Sphingomonas sp. Leaf34]KQN33244.1 MarR family transcriptional regulator [Sphingomonas sp. Leaf38]